MSERMRAGWIAAAVIFALYGGLALGVNFPKAAIDIQSDEATYLAMAYSLAYDWDLTYRRSDLDRFFEEWRNGPGGIFLKRGLRPTGVGLTASPPFLRIHGIPDSDLTRLYYGKSFVYPLFAAPFVRLFGTNGLLLLNALLLVGAFLAAYAFLSARSSITVSLVLAGGFIFASVIPVYFVWTTPELFNFALAVFAYFLWLYKYVAPSGAGWLRGRASDVAAGALIGLLTFSKVTNILLVIAPLVWFSWRRDWRTALGVLGACVLVASLFFGVNVAVSGEWNYQGGDRRTCYNTFPFQKDAGFEVCQERARSAGLFDEILDMRVFWSNLRANLWYFIAGRYGGLFAYFFPSLFAVGAFLLARGRREPWQWIVLAGLVLQILVFIVTLPYTYLGGGGSVGNRYFTGVYGLALFLLPPIRSVGAALVPWVIGAFFMGELILNPFQTSIRPFEPAKSGPLRLFPVELTNVNDLPIVNESHRVMQWYGGREGKPGFQVYHLDDNAFLREADGKSFSVRGKSRAEMLIKADAFISADPFIRLPPRQLAFEIVSERVPNRVEVKLGNRSVSAQLEPGQVWSPQLEMPPGFPYNLQQGDTPRPEPAYVWVLSISTTNGFSPKSIDPASPDTRFIGVRVTPSLIR